MVPRRLIHHNRVEAHHDVTNPGDQLYMCPDRPSNLPSRPHWLLRRADQAAVAVLLLAGLAGTLGWWLSHGGLRGRLIEVERAQPRTAAFEVDVNTATWPELVQLPGIGESLARRIVESRQADGPFFDYEQLRRVKGIGPKTLERIRPYLRPTPGVDVAVSD